MEFEDRLKALIFCHLEEHASGRHLIQVLKEDGFAREHIAPKDGIEKSSFFWKGSILSSGLKPKQSKPQYNRIPFNPAASSFMMPKSFWARIKTIGKRKHPCVLSRIVPAALNIGSPPINRDRELLWFLIASAFRRLEKRRCIG
ncbi:MAG: hypothetical protein SWC96_14300 [Thermodesulfobacteriota bacterium]|nr:hypothetical protein [Thermodesulfobacteriota bacterium]